MLILSACTYKQGVKLWGMENGPELGGLGKLKMLAREA